MQMSLCHKCNLPVYFAERKTSLGKQWHRACLSCAECGKVLHPGQHAQHKGTPYCNIPCYRALFSPAMFGHGSKIEAHNNFGNQPILISSQVKKSDLEAKLRIYNDHYEGKNLQIRSKEVNGRLVLEGPLRIHWEVQQSIKLAEKDESLASKETWRRSYTIAMANGLDEELLQKMDNGAESVKRLSTSLTNLFDKLDDNVNGKNDSDVSAVETLTRFSTVVIRTDSKRRRNRRRLSIINGHIFNVDTSVFTPAYGSITSVTVSSLDPVQVVLKHLLTKFKVENNPKDFCLCIVKSNGETRVLKPDDSPLLERVMLGPFEDTAKIFIRDEGTVYDVNEKVAQYVNLPDAVLKGFLHKLQEEEHKEEIFVRLRYHQMKKRLEERLDDFNSTHL